LVVFDENDNVLHARIARLDVYVLGYKNYIDCPKCVYGTLNNIRKNYYYCIDCGTSFEKVDGVFVRTNEEV